MKVPHGVNTDLQDMKYTGHTQKSIKMLYGVYNRCGHGFLEKVCDNAMMRECRRDGIAAPSHSPIEVLYEDEIAGECSADILVGNEVIVE